MARISRLLVLLGIAAAASIPIRSEAPRPPETPKAQPEEKIKDWKKEFEAICAKTQDAMALSDDDLKALVKRSDDLAPIVDKLPESERKVYSKRLKSCRNVFSYVLDSRQKG